MDKRLLKAKEVATMLSLGNSTIYAYVQAGVIKPVYLPSVRKSNATKLNKRAIRFKVEDIDDFIHTLHG